MLCVNNNQYLIPANSKKSKLILSIFTPVDLGILITGIIITFVLLITIKDNNFWTTILMICPALFAVFLVLPIPYYHNMRTFIRNIYRFFTNRRRYYWKGWCVRDGQRK